MLEVIEEKQVVKVDDSIPGIDIVVTNVLTGDINTDPDKIIKTTQTVRTGILRELTNHGTYLPTDKDTLLMTMQLMRDMDGTAQTATKLNIDANTSVNSANVAALADMIIMRSNIGNQKTSDRPDPMAGVELPVIEFTLDEITQGETPLSPDDWIEDRD